MSAKGPIVIALAAVLAATASAGLSALSVRAPSSEVSSRREDLVIRDVAVVNPGGQRLPAAEIHVADGRIQAVVPRAAKQPARRFALPGLIDLHVHVWSEHADMTALLLLSHGVTTVRDLGDSEGRIFATRASWENRDRLAPRLFACGPFIDGEPPVWADSRVPKDVTDARRIVDEIAAQGASCIKVYRGVALEHLDAIREEAHRHHLPVVGHVPDGTRLERARLDDVQHLTGVPEKRASGGIVALESRVEKWVAAWERLDDERIAEVARASRDLDVAHTPTLVFWERFFRLLDVDAPPPRLTLLIPDHHREEHWPRRPSWSRSANDRRDLRGAMVRMKQAVGSLHQAGVEIRAGSDSLNPYNLPGESLHAELRLLAEAGLGAEEAWRIATSGAARALGRTDLGVVAEGAKADFLIFREDPTRDLAALDTLEAVVIRGREVSRHELERRLAEIRKQEAKLDVLWSAWASVLDGLGLDDRAP